MFFACRKQKQDKKSGNLFSLLFYKRKEKKRKEKERKGKEKQKRMQSTNEKKDKIALCFLISGKHILHKESLWREWIEANEDIINVYFYYQDFHLITSPWIQAHCLPAASIVCETTYYHVIPAYFSLMEYAAKVDQGQNQWFCFLTESCCPIISPLQFRHLFERHKTSSILRWSKPWWNVHLHRRANLYLLPEAMRFGNDPWFTLSREAVYDCIMLLNSRVAMVKGICKGGLANESLFAILLYLSTKLHDDRKVKNASTHIVDWTRQSSPTSPYLFQQKDDMEKDWTFIQTQLKENPYAMFLRKVHADFPDDMIRRAMDFSAQRATTLTTGKTSTLASVTIPYMLFLVLTNSGILFVSCVAVIYFFRYLHYE